MPLYESTFIIRPDMSTGDVEKLTVRLTDIITSNGGKIVKNESWGLRSLAYRINKTRKGHYFLLGIDAPAAAIHELDRQAGLSEDVMRQLTIKVDEISQEPSAVLRRERTERDERNAA